MEFLEELVQHVDWAEVLSAVWSLILLPIIVYIGTAVNEWLTAKKLDKYGKILYEEVVKAVKSVQETVVTDIKGTDAWTDEKKAEVCELAKTKAVQALSSIAYRSLKEANDDFEAYLDSLIGTALFDIKTGAK